MEPLLLCQLPLLPRTTWVCLLIVLVGSTQIIGYLIGSPGLGGLGVVSGIAPYPKVFCEAEGYEPFAARFQLSGTTAEGLPQTIELTPEIYQKMGGPYLRRNVYGASLAYAPRLSPALRQQLFQSLPELARELGLPSLKDVTLTVLPRAGEKERAYAYSVPDLTRE